MSMNSNECHPNANISAETKKINKTILTELQSVKLDSTFYSFRLPFLIEEISI